MVLVWHGPQTPSLSFLILSLSFPCPSTEGIELGDFYQLSSPGCSLNEGVF